MNKHLLTTTTENDDNVKPIFLNEEQLLVMLDCLNMCSEQVLNSANDIVVLDQDTFNIKYQANILAEVISTVESILDNFNDIMYYDDMVEDIIKNYCGGYHTYIDDKSQRRLELEKELNALQDERATLRRVVNNRQNKTIVDLYTKTLKAIEVRIDEVECQLRKAEHDDWQQEKNNLVAVYEEMTALYARANKLANDGDCTLANHANLFTITCKEKSFSTGLQYTNYKQISQALGNIYTTVYGGSKRILDDIQQKYDEVNDYE